MLCNRFGEKSYLGGGEVNENLGKGQIQIDGYVDRQIEKRERERFMKVERGDIQRGGNEQVIERGNRGYIEV